MTGQGSPQPVVGCPGALPRTALDGDGSKNGDVDGGAAAGHGCLCQGGHVGPKDGGHAESLFESYDVFLYDFMISPWLMVIELIFNGRIYIYRYIYTYTYTYIYIYIRECNEIFGQQYVFG